MAINLTHDQLVAMYSYPFPPEDGFIYDDVALQHWLEDTFQPVSETFAQSSRKATPAARSLALLGATSAVVERALVEQRVAQDLDPQTADTVVKATASRIGAFADGLLASSPVCDVVPVPLRRVPIVLGPWVVVLIPPPVPPPVPPDWEDGEDISPYDCIGVATQLRAAARVPELKAVAEPFETAADRLLLAAEKRLG